MSSLTPSHKTTSITLAVIYFTLITTIIETRSSSYDNSYEPRQSYSTIRNNHHKRTSSDEFMKRFTTASDMRGKSLDQLSLVTHAGGVDDSRFRTTNTRWSGRQLNLPNVSLAASNLQRIRKNYSCKKPRPRLVKVKDHYHVYDKTYVPGCTLLYKCDDEAGCCENDAMRCKAKMQEAVTVYFYALYHNETKSNTVEPLVFTNDTECECREVNPHPRTFEPELEQYSPVERISETKPSDLNDKDLSLTYFMPSNTGVGSSSTTTSTTTEVPTFFNAGENDRVNMLENEKVFKENTGNGLLHKKSECAHIKCPHPFQAQKVTESPFLRCTCSCAENHEFSKCLAVKKGLHKLSYKERRCVQQGECLEPVCEFLGPYDTISGRCPKEDDDPSYSDKKIQSSYPHHRGHHPR